MITKKHTPYLFLAPYLIMFTLFIVVPTVMAFGLSFTNYNAVQAPAFSGLTNYVNLLTQDTIGPIEERRENENTWGGMQSYGLGFHEYFQLCEDLGAQPVPVVSAAMLCQVRGSKGLPLMGQGLQDYIQDVLDLVAYAREPADGPWGSKRAANGHKEPFELNFLAIGNENWGSEYFYRYGLIARAVKERYSDITCIVAAGPVAEGDLIRDSWAAIRRQYPQDVVDEHYYMPSEWFLRNTTR